MVPIKNPYLSKHILQIVQSKNRLMMIDRNGNFLLWGPPAAIQTRSRQFAHFTLWTATKRTPSTSTTKAESGEGRGKGRQTDKCSPSTPTTTYSSPSTLKIIANYQHPITGNRTSTVFCMLFITSKWTPGNINVNDLIEVG